MKVLFLHIPDLKSKIKKKKKRIKKALSTLVSSSSIFEVSSLNDKHLLRECRILFSLVFRRPLGVQRRLLTSRF